MTIKNPLEGYDDIYTIVVEQDLNADPLCPDWDLLEYRGVFVDDKDAETYIAENSKEHQRYTIVVIEPQE